MDSIYVITDNIGLLAWAVRHTLSVSILGMVLGIIMGALVCYWRLSPSKWLSFPARVYISFFRGVPLIVQLLLSYYLLPVIGLELTPFAAAVGTIGLCAAAYIAEIIRGGLAALPPGQEEAAITLGIPKNKIWTRILIPQALRISLPALTSELILLVKVSSLISIVGIVELTRMSQSLSAATFRPLEIYITAACIYLIINLIIANIGNRIEKRMAV